MDHAGRVRRSQSLSHLDGDPDGSRHIHRPAKALQVRRQVLALEKFHDQIGVPVELVPVDDRDDVGVLQAREDLCFATETPQHGRVVGPVTGEHLDGKTPRKADVLDDVNARHPAPAEESVDTIGFVEELTR